MYFAKKGTPHHDGAETYRVTFVLKESGDQHDVRGAFVQFTIRPETVTLVWERWMQNGVLSEWRRVGNRPRGAFSAFEGPRVMKDGSTSDKQRGVAEVFGARGLSAYAASFPDLQKIIDAVESDLPA